MCGWVGVRARACRHGLLSTYSVWATVLYAGTGGGFRLGEFKSLAWGHTAVGWSWQGLKETQQLLHCFISCRKTKSNLGVGCLSSSPPWSVHAKSIQSCPTVCDPMAVARQALSMGFSRQEYWNGLPCPPPGDLPDLGIEPGSLALQPDSLPSEPPGKPRL